MKKYFPKQKYWSFKYLFSSWPKQLIQMLTTYQISHGDIHVVKLLRYSNDLFRFYRRFLFYIHVDEIIHNKNVKRKGNFTSLEITFIILQQMQLKNESLNETGLRYSAHCKTIVEFTWLKSFPISTPYSG